MVRRGFVALLILAAAGCTGDLSGGGGGGDDDPIADDAAFIFDEATIRHYDLTIAPADLDHLNATATEEMYVPATFTYGQEVVPVASVRYKGSYGNLYNCFDGAGNRTCPKLSVKVSFNETEPERTFHGLRKLNFHSLGQDPSKLRDSLGYKLFRDLGLPAPRTAFARLAVNGEDWGLFLVVENVDRRFTRARWGDEVGKGNLYEDAWPVGIEPGPYAAKLKTNEDAPDVSKIVRLAAEIDGAGDAGFVGVLDRWDMTDELARYMALARLLDHWDDVTAFYCGDGSSCGNHNYYWFEDPTRDQLTLIPWDLDNVLDENPLRGFGYPEWNDLTQPCEPIQRPWGYMKAPGCDPILRRMVTQLDGPYAAATRELLDGPFAEAALDARIDQLIALIAAEIPTDSHGPSVDEWNAGIADVRARIPEKRTMIEARLR